MEFTRDGIQEVSRIYEIFKEKMGRSLGDLSFLDYTDEELEIIGQEEELRKFKRKFIEKDRLNLNLNVGSLILGEESECQRRWLLNVAKNYPQCSAKIYMVFPEWDPNMYSTLLRTFYDESREKD